VVGCVALRRNNSQRELFYLSKGERRNPFALIHYFWLMKFVARGEKRWGATALQDAIA
jgi:hypothetical protein